VQGRMTVDWRQLATAGGSPSVMLAAATACRHVAHPGLGDRGTIGCDVYSARSRTDGDASLRVDAQSDETVSACQAGGSVMCIRRNNHVCAGCVSVYQGVRACACGAMRDHPACRRGTGCGRQ